MAKATTVKQSFVYDLTLHTRRSILLALLLVQYQATSLGFKANTIASGCETQNSKLRTYICTRPIRLPVDERSSPHGCR
jgi:hypothetical protein